MITIDGSAGEGGGQVLRYACALSLLTGEPFAITNIRGGRKKPGLMRQHVTSIEAARAIGVADCGDLAVGAQELTFKPGNVTPGEYRFAVGTAGSTGLVLQTILVPLMMTSGPSRVVIEGGTHAASAPPFEFIEKTLFPVLSRMGPTLRAKLVRHGFFPRGGGRIEIDIEPAPLRQIDCLERGEPTSREAMVLTAGLPGEIAEREMTVLRKTLADWPEDAFVLRGLPDGPGNAMILTAGYENVTEVMSDFGKIGVPAERLAKNVGRRTQGYIASTAFAGPYLQDQLLLPFAMAGGGRFTSVKVSPHTRTAAGLIERFTGVRTRITDVAGGGHLVELVR